MLRIGAEYLTPWVWAASPGGVGVGRVVGCWGMMGGGEGVREHNIAELCVVGRYR